MYGKREPLSTMGQEHEPLRTSAWEASPMAKVMANHVGPNTSYRQGYKMMSGMPADSSETLQLSQRNDESQPATITRDRYILVIVDTKAAPGPALCALSVTIAFLLGSFVTLWNIPIHKEDFHTYFLQ